VTKPGEINPVTEIVKPGDGDKNPVTETAPLKSGFLKKTGDGDSSDPEPF